MSSIRRSFFGVAGGFTPFIASADFNPNAQPVNLMTLWTEYVNPNKAWIFSFSDAYNTLALGAGTGVSYRYGYTRAGTDYVFDVLSASNPFTAGDTKRWVIACTSSSNLNIPNIIGVVWAIYGSKVATLTYFGNINTYMKYVHYAGVCRITTIGATTFNGCAALTGILTIPSSVSYIGQQSFSGCVGLTGDLIIPSSVSSIDTFAFDGCTGLGNLTLPNRAITFGSNPFLRSKLIMTNQIGTNWEISDGILYKDLTRTYLVGSSLRKAGVLTIPNTVTTIGVGAFVSCTDLTGTLTIPSSVTTILESAFQQVNKLTGSISIPSSVTLIGKNAFYLCTGFDGTLSLPSGLLTINDNAFGSCNKLTGSLVIPNSVTTLGAYAFSTCTGFNGTLTLSTSLSVIRDYAFQGCSGLVGSVNIPNSVITIGISSFDSCSNLDGTLTLGSSVATIGMSAFYNCNKLTGSVMIPASVSTIDTGAFDGCVGLTGTLTLPNRSIAFGINPFLRSNVIMPDQTGTNWEIYDNVLYSNLIRTVVVGTSRAKTGTLTLPASVITIGQSAFIQCTNLTGSLILPASLTTIGNYCFRFCAGLTGSLTIPASVTSVGESAFNSCTGFSGALNINCLTPTIGITAFAGLLTTALNIAVGYNASATGYNYTFNFNNNLTAASVDQSVLNITTPVSGTKTLTISTTNKTRWTTAYPTSEATANARNIFIV